MGRQYRVVLITASLILSLTITGCERASLAPLPYSETGTGQIQGHVSGTGSNSIQNPPAPPTHWHILSVEWDSFLSPRDSDFVISDSTRLLIDGRSVEATSAGRLTRALMKLSGNPPVTVTYRKASADSTEAPDPDSAVATKIIVTTR